MLGSRNRSMWSIACFGLAMGLAVLNCGVWASEEGGLKTSTLPPARPGPYSAPHPWAYPCHHPWYGVPFVRYSFWPSTLVGPPRIVIRPTSIGPDAVLTPNYSPETALVITSLEAGPAHNAGFKPGDILIRVDGIRTRTFADLRGALMKSVGISRVLFYRPQTGQVDRTLVRIIDTRIGVTVVTVPIEIDEVVETPWIHGPS